MFWRPSVRGQIQAKGNCMSLQWRRLYVNSWMTWTIDPSAAWEELPSVAGAKLQGLWSHRRPGRRKVPLVEEESHPLNPWRYRKLTRWTVARTGDPLLDDGVTHLIRRLALPDSMDGK